MITVPKGFRAAGVAAGIKSSGARDVALVVNDGPEHVAAGTFTTNKVRAAPVLWSEQVLEEGRLRAVLLNSGCANACTGPGGFQDTHASAERLGELLGTGAIEIGVCSTGLIGSRLPMDALHGGIDAAVRALDTGESADHAAANAVLTTDTTEKQASSRHADGWSIGGFAKGAGMCAPNMATMLSVLTTDAVLDAETAKRVLASVVERTYNTLDVDGGTSTNDTVLLLASGASGVRVDPERFGEELHGVCADLVRQLQADAEGVTKRVTITVRGAVSAADARLLARTVAEDALVGTAMFGQDPNWGRIAMAAGRAGAELDPDRLDIAVGGETLCRGGLATGDRAKAELSGPDITVEIGLNLGDAEASVLTTDLSHGYVAENSEYPS